MCWVALVLIWLALLGGMAQLRAVAGPVDPASPAGLAGLRTGEEVLAVDAESIANRRELEMALLGFRGTSGTLNILVSTPGGAQRDLMVVLTDWQLPEGMAPSEALGIGFPRVEHAIILDQVRDAGAAARAGLRPGDQLVALDGEPLTAWFDLVEEIVRRPGGLMELELMRQGLLMRLQVRLDSRTVDGKLQGFLGVSVAPTRWPETLLVSQHYGPLDAVLPAMAQVWSDASMIITSVSQLLTGRASVRELGGPITVVRFTSEATQAGSWVFLRMLALISMTLAIFNLLPLPGLDGGHLLLQASERIYGRELPMMLQRIWAISGLTLLGLLIIFVIGLDLSRL